MIVGKATTVALLMFLFAGLGKGDDIDQYFADLEDIENPSWESLKETLVVGANSFGPALGSTIQVNHDATKPGLYADREISRPVNLHSPTHSYIGKANLDRMSRWYQEDKNIQIFRLFPGDDNVRNSRINAPRSEAFSPVKWQTWRWLARVVRSVHFPQS